MDSRILQTLRKENNVLIHKSLISPYFYIYEAQIFNKVGKQICRKFYLKLRQIYLISSAIQSNTKNQLALQSYEDAKCMNEKNQKLNLLNKQIGISQKQKTQNSSIIVRNTKAIVSIYESFENILLMNPKKKHKRHELKTNIQKEKVNIKYSKFKISPYYIFDPTLTEFSSFAFEQIKRLLEQQKQFQNKTQGVIKNLLKSSEKIITKQCADNINNVHQKQEQQIQHILNYLEHQQIIKSQYFDEDQNDENCKNFDNLSCKIFNLCQFNRIDKLDSSQTNTKSKQTKSLDKYLKNRILFRTRLQVNQLASKLIKKLSKLQQDKFINKFVLHPKYIYCDAKLKQIKFSPQPLLLEYFGLQKYPMTIEQQLVWKLSQCQLDIYEELDHFYDDKRQGIQIIKSKNRYFLKINKNILKYIFIVSEYSKSDYVLKKKISLCKQQAKSQIFKEYFYQLFFQQSILDKETVEQTLGCNYELYKNIKYLRNEIQLCSFKKKQKFKKDYFNIQVENNGCSSTTFEYQIQNNQNQDYFCQRIIEFKCSDFLSVYHLKLQSIQGERNYQNEISTRHLNFFKSKLIKIADEYNQTLIALITVKKVMKNHQYNIPQILTILWQYIMFQLYIIQKHNRQVYFEKNQEILDLRSQFYKDLQQEIEYSFSQLVGQKGFIKKLEKLNNPYFNHQERVTILNFIKQILCQQGFIIKDNQFIVDKFIQDGKSFWNVKNNHSKHLANVCQLDLQSVKFNRICLIRKQMQTKLQYILSWLQQFQNQLQKFYIPVYLQYKGEERIKYSFQKFYFHCLYHLKLDNADQISNYLKIIEKSKKNQQNNTLDKTQFYINQKRKSTYEMLQEKLKLSKIPKS